MGNFLKNVLVSAGFVVVGTMATCAVATIVALFAAAAASETPFESNYAVYGAFAAMMGGALFGFFFSAVTLFIAAVTMPPALGVIRGLRLPRPLFDMLGGGAAAVLCTAIAVSAWESIARAKGGDIPEGSLRLMFDICAMVGGALIAYVRYLVLAPKDAAPAVQIAPQWQAEGGG